MSGISGSIKSSFVLNLGGERRDSVFQVSRESSGTSRRQSLEKVLPLWCQRGGETPKATSMPILPNRRMTHSASSTSLQKCCSFQQSFPACTSRGFTSPGSSVPQFPSHRWVTEGQWALSRSKHKVGSTSLELLLSVLSQPCQQLRRRPESLTEGS